MSRVGINEALTLVSRKGLKLELATEAPMHLAIGRGRGLRQVTEMREPANGGL